MTAPSTDELKALLERSTKGRRVQFHGRYCPEAKDTPYTEWDSSHETSVILGDGKRYRGYSQHKHAADAALDALSPILAAEVIRLREAIDDVVCARGMFGVDVYEDLRWAMSHLHQALDTLPAR